MVVINFSGRQTAISINVSANGCYQFAARSLQCLREWMLPTSSYLQQITGNNCYNYSFIITLSWKWCYQSAVIRGNVFSNGWYQFAVTCNSVLAMFAIICGLFAPSYQQMNAINLQCRSNVWQICSLSASLSLQMCAINWQLSAAMY